MRALRGVCISKVVWSTDILSDSLKVLLVVGMPLQLILQTHLPIVAVILGWQDFATGVADIVKAPWDLDKSTERHKRQEVLKIEMNFHVLIAHHLLGKGSGFSNNCLLHTDSSFPHSKLKFVPCQEEGMALGNTLYETHLDHLVEEANDIKSGVEDLRAQGMNLKAGEAEWNFIDFGML